MKRLGDSDTEFVSEEPLADVDDINTEESDHHFLAPEAIIHNTPVSRDEPSPRRKLREKIN